MSLPPPPIELHPTLAALRANVEEDDCLGGLIVDADLERDFLETEAVLLDYERSHDDIAQAVGQFTKSHNTFHAYRYLSNLKAAHPQVDFEELLVIGIGNGEIAVWTNPALPFALAMFSSNMYMSTWREWVKRGLFDDASHFERSSLYKVFDRWKEERSLRSSARSEKEAPTHIGAKPQTTVYQEARRHPRAFPEIDSTFLGDARFFLALYDRWAPQLDTSYRPLAEAPLRDLVALLSG